MPFYIRNLFNFRKTMVDANAPPVPKPERARAEATSTPRRTQAPARRRGNNRSIFSRITSSFKALRERNQSRAETRKVSKEIEENMPNFKKSMPRELQNMRDKMEVKPQEISTAYIKDFSSLKKGFTDDEDRMKVSSESIMTIAEKNQDESASGYVQHLIRFCGGDKDQASTLSTLLTKEAVNTVHQELIKYSNELCARLEVGKPESRVDIRMMPNGTARVAITRKVGSANTADVHYVATIITRFEVPRQSANTELIGRGLDFQNPIILENVECKYVLRPPVAL